MKNITKKILAFLIAFTMIIPLFLAFQIYQVEATATYTHLNRQELARELIRRHNNQQILIMGAWGSMSTVAGTTSICNIRQTAEGRMATTGIPSGQTTPIANTYLSEDLLRAILMLNDRFGRFQINSIAGGRHSRNSNHYRGRAVDFQFLGVYRPANIPVNARQNNWSVITFLREHGFILENYFGDAHHFHIGILGYNPRGGIVATPPTVQVTRNVMIIYNANGGMDAPPNLTVTLDMSGVARFSHSVTRPFKEGYRFNGWLLNNDSRYPIQVHGGLSTINTNIIDGDSFEFFAQWSPVELGTVTIIYNANGGNNAPSNQTVALDNNGFARFNHPTTTPTRNGYTFLGWQIYDDSRYPIEPAGASAGVNTGSTTGGGSFEFFAQWSPLVLGTVTIIYNANGGSNAPPSQAVTLDSDGVARFNHPINIPTRNGYIFLGWQIYDDSRYPIEPAGASAGINIGSTTGGGSFEFFAQWSPVVLRTATIRYNANGGSGTPSTHTVTIPQDGLTTFYLATNSPTRDGYAFIGWRLENDSAFDIDNSRQRITIQLDPNNDTTLTYYAQWQEQAPQVGTLTVRYNANGGIGAPPDYVITIQSRNTTFVIPRAMPTREGYTFLGWRLDNIASGEMINPGQGRMKVLDQNSNTTLTYYAQWQSNAVSDTASNIRFTTNLNTVVRANHYRSSITLLVLPSNFSVTISDYVINSYGERWYRVIRANNTWVSNEGWIYSGDLSHTRP